MKIRYVTGLALVALAATNNWANSQDDITSMKVGENRYEITLRSQNVMDIASATRLLTPTATTLCGDLTANLGRYKFEQSEAITAEKDDDWFTITQDVHCVNMIAKEPSENRRAQLKTEAEVNAVRKKVRMLSKEYFENRYSKLGTDASLAFRATKNSESALPEIEEPTARGTPLEIDLYRITVYDNPQSAPSKGIYVAVDYDNRIGNIAHHCGYLMWHSNDGSEFKLGRIESGTLDENLLAKMKPGDISPTLKALRCSNFYEK